LKKVFLDTNIFIRYLVNDIPDQVDKVEDLFDRAERGEIRLVTGPPVFFEIAWTLKSFYNMNRKRIYGCLRGIIGLQGLEIIDLKIIEEALEIYNQTSADFNDAYIAVLSQKNGADSIATFNIRHFKNLNVQLYDFE
jgi:predicted nucleic-acid-binding protein